MKRLLFEYMHYGEIGYWPTATIDFGQEYECPMCRSLLRTDRNNQIKCTNCRFVGFYGVGKKCLCGTDQYMVCPPCEKEIMAQADKEARDTWEELSQYYDND